MLFLSFSPLWSTLGPHVRAVSGVKSGEEMMLAVLSLSDSWSDSYPGPRTEIAGSSATSINFLISEIYLISASVSLTETKDRPLPEAGRMLSKATEARSQSSSNAGAAQALWRPLSRSARLPPPPASPSSPCHSVFLRLQGCTPGSCLFAEICTKIKPIKLSAPLWGCSHVSPCHDN